MKRKIAVALAAAVVLAVVGGIAIRADEFTKKDQERWEKEYMSVVQKGRALWTSPPLGTNGVACAQCHPNARQHPPGDLPEVPAAARPGDRAARDDQLVHPAAARGQAPGPRRARTWSRWRPTSRTSGGAWRSPPASTDDGKGSGLESRIKTRDLTPQGSVRCLLTEGGAGTAVAGGSAAARQWATVSLLAATRRPSARRVPFSPRWRSRCSPRPAPSPRARARPSASASSPRSRTSPTACSGSYGGDARPPPRAPRPVRTWTWATW